jgi:hypothetical protein
VALLQRVLLGLQVFAVLLLLDSELLHCRQVALLLVLLIHLALGRTASLVLLAIAEHLLLQSGQVDLLQAWTDLLFFLLLRLSPSRLQIDEIEIGGMFT